MQTDSSFQAGSSFEWKALARRAVYSSALQLGLFGALSGAIYWFAFAHAYSLGELWNSPGQTIAKLANFAPLAGLAYVLAMAALFGLYLLALRSARFESNRRNLLLIGLIAVLFNGVLLSLYPVDSADIFDNIIRGRMTTFYGLNPFVAFPLAIKNDPFYAYIGWKFVPSAYGPLWEWLAAAGAWVAGNQVIANMLVFKLLSVGAALGTALLVVRMLQRIAPERAAYGAVFVLWNPLWLYTTAGTGHNDTVMVLFATLGFYFLMQRRFTLAVLAETAGALIKFIPILFIPLILLAAWQAQPSWKARTRFLILTAAACLILSALAYARFWDGKLLDLDWRWDLYTTSLSTWAWLALQQIVAPKFASLLVSRAGFLLLAAWMVRELRILWQHGSARQGELDIQPYVRAALSILLFYLLVSATWFQTWYVVWLLPLAALLPIGLLVQETLILCVAALWKMPFVDFLWVQNANPIARDWASEVPLTLAVLSVPWAFWGIRWWKRRKTL